MKNTSPARFAICLKNKGCEDLVVRKVYPILPDERAEMEEASPTSSTGAWSRMTLAPSRHLLLAPFLRAVKRFDIPSYAS